MWRRIKDIEFERIRIFCNCAGTIDSEKFIEIDTMLWNNIGLSVGLITQSAPIFLHFLYTTLDPLIKQVYQLARKLNNSFQSLVVNTSLNNVLCSML
uniref:Uncharacterized protein n=1 Tax=Heterorhabditis bacteriophora TaxID=37862 RepID=A0A1I7W6S3_HETBA